ncbi:MAG: caspase family protein [Candidatus Cloacimonetes bacterium]|nr:caspase family protein [Candidatus Cloacimonadota bacterium]HNZ06968.1 caspase family protein [Candidatus Cloacimonadota bacterium]HOH78856.1 caspase family protein [Candidatus Cloacimonadota bacterium]
MRNKILAITLLAMLWTSTVCALGIDGIWISQADGSQYSFSGSSASISLLGFDLSAAKFKKHDIKYRDIGFDQKSGLYYGQNRVNDGSGNLHSWRLVSMSLPSADQMVITDVQSAASLTLVRSYWEDNIPAYYNSLNGAWKRGDDGSEYLFVQNQATLKSVGPNLAKGKFQVNQVKLRNIIPLSLNNFMGENRQHKSDGTINSWDRVRISLMGDQLTITGSQAGDVLKLTRRVEPGNIVANPVVPVTNPSVSTPAVTPSPSPASTLSPSPDLVGGLPKSKTQNPHAIAVVIGNRDYDESVISKVDFAINDADAIKYYLLNVFGYKESNILYYRNATLLDLYSVFGKENNHRGKLNSWVEASSVKPDVFVYYSGHGAPDVQSGSAYLVPVDCDSPDRISVNGYSINVLYDNLSKLPYNTLTVVLEACFSGNSEKGLMLKSTSPVALKANVTAPKVSGATIVTSTSGEQLAHWYPEKSQSLFTYYYLLGLKGEADANKDHKISTLELKTYVEQNVNSYALRNRDRNQKPLFSTSEDRILVSFE